MTAGLKAALGVSLAASVVCLVRLWRGRSRIPSKLAWSVVALMPLLGPLVFAMWHEPPDPSDPIDRPPEDLDV